MHPLTDVAGIGLRNAHARRIAEQRPALGWLEVHTENLFGDDPRRHRRMEQLRSGYALSLHGVGLSLGTAGSLDAAHLSQVATVVRRYEPALVSEHACWGARADRHTNQLLPLPFTLEAAQVLSDHIDEVQQALGRSIAIEPIARYLEFSTAEMTEPEFLAEVVKCSGCQLLLDVSNLHINAHNFGFDPLPWLDAVSTLPVVEIHLAGFRCSQDILIDSHDARIDAQVWNLYRCALQRLGPRPTLIEWDANLPPLDVLIDEMNTADELLQQATPGTAA